MLPLLNTLSLLLILFSLSSMSSSKKLIFILSGQSNMSGRGGVNDNKWDRKVPPESHPSPSILRLTANLTWVEAAEPLHADIDVSKPCGVGPGLPFANSVLSGSGGAGGEVLGLVPCAIGGTGIRRWARGTRLYENMVRRAKAASTAEGGDGGRIGAVLWYQGESDAESKEDAEAYRGRMERLVEDLRLDLGNPHLLIIQVAIVSGGKFVETVRQAQLGIDLPNVLCVDAKGLPLKSDGLHLTTEAQVQLGKMLATAYLNHCCARVTINPNVISRDDKLK